MQMFRHLMMMTMLWRKVYAIKVNYGDQKILMDYILWETLHVHPIWILYTKVWTEIQRQFSIFAMWLEKIL